MKRDQERPQETDHLYQVLKTRRRQSSYCLIERNSYKPSARKGTKAAQAVCPLESRQHPTGKQVVPGGSRLEWRVYLRLRLALRLPPLGDCPTSLHARTARRASAQREPAAGTAGKMRSEPAVADNVPPGSPWRTLLATDPRPEAEVPV